MTCKRCGLEFSDETNFCPNCGTPTFSKKEVFVEKREFEPADSATENTSESVYENEFSTGADEKFELVGNEGGINANLPVPVGPVYDETPESVSPHGVRTNLAGYYEIEDALPGKGLGITSMILGIFALVITLSQQCLYAIPFGVAGLILGCISKSKAKRVGRSNKLASAGFICSIVALGICAFAITASLEELSGDSVPFGDGDVDL